MSWLVQPRLVNDPFSDPGVFADFRFGRRALLFDLGDLSPLSSRELLRVSHVFVSHAHMDHFAGFDRLLRLCLHRPQPLQLVGPADFIERVEHRLRSYSWNLVGPHSVDFRLAVGEFAGGAFARAAIFPAQDAFARRKIAPALVEPGRVLREDEFHIEAVELDHGIPSLAFALRERIRVSVWRGALDRLGLPVGPWISAAKRAIRAGEPNETLVEVPVKGTMTLADLKAEAFRVGPGQTVAYVVDCACTDANIAKILALARGADQLFIEAAFLDEDRAIAAERRHLTAAQAGRLARLAGARRFTPLHFSPRYLDRPDVLLDEAERAFWGTTEPSAGS
jgi:ribonuclease Z